MMTPEFLFWMLYQIFVGFFLLPSIYHLVISLSCFFLNGFSTPLHVDLLRLSTKEDALPTQAKG